LQHASLVKRTAHARDEREDERERDEDPRKHRQARRVPRGDEAGREGHATPAELLPHIQPPSSPWTRGPSVVRRKVTGSPPARGVCFRFQSPFGIRLAFLDECVISPATAWRT